MKRREFITLLGGAIAPVILVTALLVPARPSLL
jgi:hypothetical protein